MSVVIPDGCYTARILCTDAQWCNGRSGRITKKTKEHSITSSKRSSTIAPERLHGEGVQGAEPILGDDAHIAHLHAPAF